MGQEISFAVVRDKLIYAFILFMTIMTAVLFISSPSKLFPMWYCLCIIIIYSSRILDYSQKKYQFYLIDFCYTAGLQILYYLMFSYQSLHMATRSFGFGAGVLGWSTILFSNGLSVHRLDEYCSLWIHTVPSVLAYSLRWTDMNSMIYYENYPIEFSKDHMAHYYIVCYAPYAIWAAGYYLVITKICRRLSIEGDYKCLADYMYEQSPSMTRILGIFGPKRHLEGFMFCHLIFFSITTFLGYICFFNKTLHTIFLGLWLVSVIMNGGEVVINDLAKPYKMKLERINQLLNNLG